MKHPAVPPFFLSRRAFLRRAALGAACLGAPSLLFARSDNIRFAPERPIRFALVADTHYADLPDTDRPRFFRASVDNMREIAARTEAIEGDFLVHLGDVIQDVKDSRLAKRFLARADAALRPFNGPRYYVLGNHDLGDLDRDEFFREVRSPILRPYFAFDVAGHRFVVLDPNYRLDGVPYARGNFRWTQSFVPPEQLLWLDAQLREAREHGMGATIFIHQNLEADQERFAVSNAADVSRVLEEAGNVALVFQGHRHVEFHTRRNDIDYVTLPAIVNGADAAGALVQIHPETGIAVRGITPRQSDYDFPPA